MDVLIVGGGGREHALAWKARQSVDAGRVYVAPGNAGTAAEPGIENLDIAADDVTGLVGRARELGIGLVIPGPEAPLVAGLADALATVGIPCFGPGAEAAQLEGSKAFAKAFMARHAIPTAAHATFTDADAAAAWIREQDTALVVKADGLAAGKGVVVARDAAAAEAAARDMLAGNAFGEAGRRVVVEEYLPGRELSFMALVDGTDVRPLATSRDHKARDDGDRGPNTGGMGAYSPAPEVDSALFQRILDEIVEPTVEGLAADGIHYRGFLYAGLMLDAAGNPRVLEYNCRLGDPETEPLLLRLESDLVALCRAGTEGGLPAAEIEWDPRPALGVVMAAGGYPGSYRKGDAITGLAGLEDGDRKVFHAGTAQAGDGAVITAGGRVLCVTARGDDLEVARRRAYAAVDAIAFDGAFCRRDIGAGDAGG
ncbi:phosphoribosylamine--glycine ligase [Thiohalospira sp.]|uniref:phosphoribosylamine--glycine ligase n=1 Tax=Thiohalospira sp. TaxID=3080549 RepID=UPI00397F5099